MFSYIVTHITKTKSKRFVFTFDVLGKLNILFANDRYITSKNVYLHV